MKIPRKGTTIYKVLFHLYQHGPATIYELIEALNLRSRAAVFDAASKYNLPRTGKSYACTQQLIKYFDDMTGAAPTQIVPARVINVFASKGLSPKYQISAEGKREGSNDHKQIKSRHA
jgi:hypothetical protein